jgi:hypothetical protein
MYDEPIGEDGNESSVQEPKEFEVANNQQADSKTDLVQEEEEDFYYEEDQTSPQK